MKISETQRLVIEEGDGLTYRFDPSPNKEKGVMAPSHLLIHATEGQNVSGAVATFKNIGGKSVHLILGRDGKELVQMLDFNVKGVHASDYNKNSIGIELDYTGHLREDEKVKHHFAYIGKFQPGEYIYARTMNEGDQQPLRPWPRYPKAQMDALVKISRLLVGQFGLKIYGHEEVYSFKLDPGPAFPMNKFKETVYGNAQGLVVADEILEAVNLRTGPGLVYPLIPNASLPKGTPVSIVGDQAGWAMVEVLAEVGGDPWLVGWVDIDLIGATRATPVVMKHKLCTTDGRQFKYIPAHPNGYDANRKLLEPKYVVIHMTGGITMSSTINWFRNESSGVSAHLLIGRDGRVIQFVDFDTPAHHCGFSYWEEDFDLNRYSIGIEIDNGANLTDLRKRDGVWKWKTTVIPDDEVQVARHWKNKGPLGWHKFTPVQLEVALEIVQALKKEYDIQVILGHDVINMQERWDPGPLFPMEEFRQKVTGRPEVKIKVYRAKEAAQIYKNTNQKPPNIDHPLHKGMLRAKSQIKVLLIKDVWTQVKVVSATGGLNKTTGWIATSAINTAQNNPKVKEDTLYYQLNPKAPAQAPPTLLKDNPLPKETLVRVEKFEEDKKWALVSPLDAQLVLKIDEGWVKADLLEFVGEEWRVFPPPWVAEPPAGPANVAVPPKVVAPGKPLVQPKMIAADKKVPGPGTGKE